MGQARGRVFGAQSVRVDLRVICGQFHFGAYLQRRCSYWIILRPLLVARLDVRLSLTRLGDALASRGRGLLGASVVFDDEAAVGDPKWVWVLVASGLILSPSALAVRAESGIYFFTLPGWVRVGFCRGGCRPRKRGLDLDRALLPAKFCREIPLSPGGIGPLLVIL